ncbi:MAG: RNA polymerase sigma factor [Gemmatimonadetes bacterium]|nr:RNA polymerase sigma factor [Gemmatimonadota bacterium]
MTAPNPPDEGLEQLVRQAQSGDEEAFRRLVERCHAQVYRWALVRTGDVDDADDVAQNVLVRLSTHLDRYDGRSRFTSWLYRVTANAAGGFFRRAAARRRMIERVKQSDTDAGTGPADPLGQVHTANAAGIVRTFFNDLPARQREILDLADLQGFAPGEIADMLKMNAATVRTHLFRARRTLRARMLEQHPALLEDLSP